MNSYEELINSYPELFSKDKESHSPFSLFGFECENGWFNIIKNTCAVLYRDYDNALWQLGLVEHSLNNIDNFVQNSKKYFDANITHETALEELTEKKKAQENRVSEAREKLPIFMQIKEKFGTLRLYCGNVDETTNAVTDFAELMSATTCEFCGQPGKTYRTGWYKTLCPTHALERYGEEVLKEYEEEEKELAEKNNH